MAATLKPILREQINKAAMVFTDEASYYRGLRADFPAGHFTVNHSVGEYVRGGATVNACENYFSILKRGINGVYQHVSPTHLKRYVGEFDFRYNNRIGLGIDDMARTEKCAKARSANGSRIKELVSSPRPKRPSGSTWRGGDRRASASDPRQLAFRFDEPDEP